MIEKRKAERRVSPAVGTHALTMLAEAQAKYEALRQRFQSLNEERERQQARVGELEREIQKICQQQADADLERDERVLVLEAALRGVMQMAMMEDECRIPMLNARAALEPQPNNAAGRAETNTTTQAVDGPAKPAPAAPLPAQAAAQRSIVADSMSQYRRLKAQGVPDERIAPSEEIRCKCRLSYRREEDYIWTCLTCGKPI